MNKYYLDQISGKKVYLMFRQKNGQECYFDENEWNIKPNLVSNQEEADTRINNALSPGINGWLPKCNSSHPRHRCISHVWKATMPTCIWKLELKKKPESSNLRL